jgi:branched-chain amino acid transport system ATP-binding protein
MSLLHVDDVVVQFGGVTAVNHASFEVQPSTVTGLIGPNGAGKTTCFNVITGLQTPTAGRVLLEGRDITRPPGHRRARRGIGRTFQRLEAFGSLTVWDNVRTALDIHDGLRGLVGGLFRSVDGSAHRDVEALLERVGIAEYADERADSVPTGVARLLELARALACDPRLLLLDEPSSGLDEAETEAFGRLLVALAGEGRTILMVEHDMELVMSVCDTIHVLDFGSIIAQGTPSEIRSNPDVQKAYLGYYEADQGGAQTGGAHAAYPADAGSDVEDTKVLS